MQMKNLVIDKIMGYNKIVMGIFCSIAVNLKNVKDVKINFNNETRPGETVELFKAESEGKIYVEGKVGDKSAFCVELGW